jgi:hypothetical protein
MGMAGKSVTDDKVYRWFMKWQIRLGFGAFTLLGMYGVASDVIHLKLLHALLVGEQGRRTGEEDRFMKVNHQRGFADERDYSCPPGCWVRGKHGAAKNKRGRKKFLRTRKRIRENLALRKALKEGSIE